MPERHSPAELACPDCGGFFPDVDGPTHAYVGGSAGCWAAFGQLGARELQLGILGPERLSVHAYTAQHPGHEGRRQAQSVGVHLMVLSAVLERGVPVADAVGAMPGWLTGRPRWPWLEPPTRPYGVSIQTLPLQADQLALESAVRVWAEAVWAGWSDHHATIRRWLDRGARPGRGGAGPSAGSRRCGSSRARSGRRAGSER